MREGAEMEGEEEIEGGGLMEGEHERGKKGR